MIDYDMKLYVDDKFYQIGNSLKDISVSIQNKIFPQKFDNTIFFKSCHFIIDDSIFYKFTKEPTHTELMKYGFGKLYTNFNLNYNLTTNSIHYEKIKESKLYFFNKFNYNVCDDTDGFIKPTDSDYFKYKKRFPTGKLMFNEYSSWFGLIKWKEVVYKISSSDIEKNELVINFNNVRTSNIKKFIDVD